MVFSVPPKYLISEVVGFLDGTIPQKKAKIIRILQKALVQFPLKRRKPNEYRRAKTTDSG
jgi:hypothetical protein